MGVREPNEGEFPQVQRSRLDLVSCIPASSLGLDEYQRLSEYTMNLTNQTEAEQLSNVALGLAGEAGEFADAVKKHLHHGHDLDVEHLRKELGDLLFYLQWGCVRCGTTLGEVAKGNLVKLATRYPAGFSKQASIERKDMLPEAKAYDAQK